MREFYSLIFDGFAVSFARQEQNISLPFPSNSIEIRVYNNIYVSKTLYSAAKNSNN